MLNPDNWKPSKFVRIRGRLMASRDAREVSVCSRLMIDTIARWYDRILPQYAHGHLLDLGCGKVPLYDAYRSSCSDVTCVDWENSLHSCEHLDRSADLTAVLPFADETFDTVLLSDVLEHIPTPEMTCTEIARVLRKNGTLIMNVPFLYWVHEQPHDYHRYTEYALERLMRISGLQTVCIDRLGGAPEVLTDVFSKIITLVPFVGKPLALLAQGATTFFAGTRIGKKLHATTSPLFPLGYGLVAVKRTP